MSTPIDESSKPPPHSTIGWFLAGMAATIIFVPLALLIFLACVALLGFPESAFLTRLFDALHTLIYEFFSGRTVPSGRSGLRSLILYHPDPKPPSKSDPPA